jgi:hypothetical protein
MILKRKSFLGARQILISWLILRIQPKECLILFRKYKRKSLRILMRIVKRIKLRLRSNDPVKGLNDSSHISF